MRYLCLAGLWRKSTLFFCAAILLILIPTACTSPAALPISQKSSSTPPCRSGHQSGFLKTLNGGLVDASGCKVVLTGVNWFGFETSTFAPHGLWARNWQDMLKQMARLGFNTIRLPYTNQLFDPTGKPQGINYQLNPDLKGLQGLALMDRIIQGVRIRGLKIILDRHDTTADQRPSLWYTDHMSEARWIQDWVMLAKHYKGNSTIIGADLDNEPHSP